jgi:hypothetical protein
VTRSRFCIRGFIRDLLGIYQVFYYIRIYAYIISIECRNLGRRFRIMCRGSLLYLVLWTLGAGDFEPRVYIIFFGMVLCIYTYWP